MSKQGLSLLICAALIFAVGLVMVFNTTSAEVLDRSLDRSTHQALIKQILYALVGGVGAMGIWFVGYQNLLKLSGPLLVFFTFLLVLVFIPPLGQQLNGANRWISIFGNSLQPSEFVKYLIPLYYIHVFKTKGWQLSLKAFLKLLGTLSIPIGLILIEPDNGTVAIILAGLIVLFLISRLKWTYWALPLLCLMTVGVAVASQMQHVSSRIQVYLHPELDLRGKGHQPHQAKIAAGSGQVFGRGIGQSLQKLDYLPEARSDYIAAIYAEECGFVGISALVLMYMLIGFFGFRISASARDMEGFYIVAIFTFLITFQAFLNFGVVSGLLPSKGTNLPFFSHGGSSLLANLMALFVILNVSKNKRLADVR